MKLCRRFKPRIPCVLLLLFSSIVCYIPVLVSSSVVTLDSIEIFRTHEWLPSKPTLYFQCNEENRTVLPDVKEKDVAYSFKGDESWQPLTELSDKKCKRCGFFEKDPIKDYEFDEWEFCASDFSMPDGKYIHFKNKEFNATFRCLECIHPESDQSSNSKGGSNRLYWILVVVLSASVSVVIFAGLISGYKYWKRRKRQQDQARFLKLFEESDDLDDELGIGPLSREI